MTLSNIKQQAAVLYMKLGRQPASRQLFASLVLVCGLLLVALEGPIEALEVKQSSDNNNNGQQRHLISDSGSGSGSRAAATAAKSALEAELESLVQQRDPFDVNDRSLAEAIISRLMLDNVASELASSESTDAELVGRNEPEPEQPQQQQQQAARYVGPAEALRLKKLLSMVEAYESMLNQGGLVPSAAGLPLLPSSQASTSKRATKLAGNYLQQRQAIAGANGNGGNSGYGRSSFDFGLGKRPDTTGASSNILRFSDSLSGGGGSVQAVNQFGKRPSAHRYDFGLGKRVASVSIPI